MELIRSSGILLHISSLPSDFGIGDLGPSAYEFVDFLEASGHSYWQILPLNPTDENFSFSPYSSYSAFAGNPLFISPELLIRDGWLRSTGTVEYKQFKPTKNSFRGAEAVKTEMLENAYQTYKSRREKVPEFEKFKEVEANWLKDYCLFLALWEKFGSPDWTSWPREFLLRDENALKKASKELASTIEKQQFIQFLFFSQWNELKSYATSKKISFFGDIPFYVTHNSADCWANAELFKLDQDGLPTHLSGVPPDYFSEEGQLWGTPVFDWTQLKKTKFDWWVRRIKQNLRLFDLVRLDHFRAFSAYWEVPAGEKTAVNGKWRKTPGDGFFQRLKKEFPTLPLIAEDLGDIDKPVYDLIAKYDFPGMKVLQFAFGEGISSNPYIPFNHSQHNVVYTGTHDNNTSLGWYKKAGKKEKDNLRIYTGKRITSNNVASILHKMALNSVAKLAIIPMQDILGLNDAARMNVPGTTEGNWIWRLRREDIPWERTAKLKEINSFYGRLPEDE